MKNFRLLRADEIECRQQKVTERGLSLLLYKTARTDADLLDETVGPENWTNDFKVIDGVLYGGIGVDYGKGWVWKWDAGTESNTEAEKGRASDAYKRAGFKHGIGRELYSSPFVWVPNTRCNIKKDPKIACYDKFSVSEIGYDADEHISLLKIRNDTTGETCFEWSTKAEPKELKERVEKCEECGMPVLDAIRNDKTVWPAADIITYSRAMAKKTLCAACARKYNSEANDIMFRCEDCGEVLKPYTDANGKTVSIRRWSEGTKKKYGKTLCEECVKQYAGNPE